MTYSKTLYVSIRTEDGRLQEFPVVVPASSEVENRFALEVALVKAGLGRDAVVSGSVSDKPRRGAGVGQYPGSAQDSFGEYPFGRCPDCGCALSITRTCRNLAGHISA